MGERKDRPSVINGAELWVYRIVQSAICQKFIPKAKIVARLVCQPVDLVCIDKWAHKVSRKQAAYLVRGVHYTTVSEPTVHFEELGLVLKGKLMADSVSCCDPPFKKLVALGKEFSGNVGV